MLRHIIILIGLVTTSVWGQVDMANITAGEYRPLYLSKDSPLVSVSTFWLDKLPVTNRDYQQFVDKNPKWQREKAPKLFVEKNYLDHWVATNGQTKPILDDLDKPVVFVSWYAAQAYCQAHEKRLPTIAEWEYVAQASIIQKNGSAEKGYNQKILDWYAKAAKNPLIKVGQDKANWWGVHNMHGLIWEWTEDFNSNLVSGESRGDSSVNKDLYCASGSVGAVDPSDYAAFLRYGFRSSLNANFTLSSLGFRCAADGND
jgi:formylglycine-generating enzyme